MTKSTLFLVIVVFISIGVVSFLVGKYSEQKRTEYYQKAYLNLSGELLNSAIKSKLEYDRLGLCFLRVAQRNKNNQLEIDSLNYFLAQQSKIEIELQVHEKTVDAIDKYKFW